MGGIGRTASKSGRKTERSDLIRTMLCTSSVSGSTNPAILFPALREALFRLWQLSCSASIRLGSLCLIYAVLLENDGGERGY